MKKWLLIILPVVALILISACALQKNINNEYDRNTLYSETSDKGAIREIHSLPKLGDLCQEIKNVANTAVRILENVKIIA